MTGEGQQIDVLLVADDDVDDVELEIIVQDLRRCLLEIDVEWAKAVLDDLASVGTKSMAQATIAGALSVGVGSVTLRSIFRLLEIWLKGRPVRSAKVTIGGQTIELSGITTTHQTMLIDRFLDGVANVGDE